MRYPIVETLKDIGLLMVVFMNWIVTSLIADAVTESATARKACAAYIAAFAAIVNVVGVARSWLYLGMEDAPRESVLGLFAEICNLTQLWGALFAAARYFSLPEGSVFFTNALIHAQAESIFEMSLVQAGVGWAASAPTTVAERIVAWAAAYVGGVLCTNMFLLSVVLSRRGYWQHAAEATPTAAAAATSAAWVVSGSDSIPLMRIARK